MPVETIHCILWLEDLLCGCVEGQLSVGGSLYVVDEPGGGNQRHPTFRRVQSNCLSIHLPIVPELAFVRYDTTLSNIYSTYLSIGCFEPSIRCDGVDEQFTFSLEVAFCI